MSTAKNISGGLPAPSWTAYHSSIDNDCGLIAAMTTD